MLKSVRLLLTSCFPLLYALYAYFPFAQQADKIEPCAFENDKRGEKNHFFVEEYLKEQRLPFTIFRPLYIYGAYTGKDCEQVRTMSSTDSNRTSYAYFFLFFVFIALQTASVKHLTPHLQFILCISCICRSGSWSASCATGRCPSPPPACS
jgi:hypothetical protein